MTLTMPKTDLGLGPQLNRATRSAGPAGSWTLANAIDVAVRKVDVRFIHPLPGQSPSDSKRLLALLTWSYTRQLYSSREIFDQLHAWAAIDCWEGGPPSGESIRRFRDENRSVLQVCLDSALRFQAQQKVSEGVVTRFNEAGVNDEAMRRIIMARFVDSLEYSQVA
jgi:hypothetical protein